MVPQQSWTLQWKGLNLYRRGRVLKIASFEGPMILRVGNQLDDEPNLYLGNGWKLPNIH